MNFHVAPCMQGSQEDFGDGQRGGQILAGTDDANVPRNRVPYCSTVLHFPVEIGRYISTQMSRRHDPLSQLAGGKSWRSQQRAEVGKDPGHRKYIV